MNEGENDEEEDESEDKDEKEKLFKILQEIGNYLKLHLDCVDKAI